MPLLHHPAGVAAKENTAPSLKRRADEVTVVNERLLFALARARADGTPQWQIAAEKMLNPTLLSLWVHGRRKPSRAQALRVADALGVDVDYLWPDLQLQANPALSAHNEQRPGVQSRALQKTTVQGRRGTA